MVLSGFNDAGKIETFHLAARAGRQSVPTARNNAQKEPAKERR